MQRPIPKFFYTIIVFPNDGPVRPEIWWS